MGSWNMPGISPVFTEATMSRYPRYCEKSLFSKCDIEKIILCGSQHSISLETMVSGPAKCMQHGWEIPALRHRPSWLSLTHKSKSSVPLGSALPFVTKLLQRKQIVRAYVKSLWESPSPYYKLLQGETHMLYIMEIIIIALKLQLIAVFLLHSGRRVFLCRKNTELSSEIRYSRVFFWNIYQNYFCLVKSMKFCVQAGLSIRIYSKRKHACPS